jgi:methylated-DNA-protein-cysteine methyltransferase related protein
MTKFQQAVVNIVNKVPKGKVVSYGQVAAYIGMPRAARQVGWTLRNLEGVDIPWWRVINNEGRISIKGNVFHDRSMQRELLLNEGVQVKENFDLEIEKYRWKPDISSLA